MVAVLCQIARPFSIEMVWDAGVLFVTALGTTWLGFVVSNVGIFFVTLVVTHVAIWVRNGQSAMKDHAHKNLGIGLLTYCIAFVVVFTSTLLIPIDG